MLVDKNVSSVVSEGWSASVEDNEKPVKCDDRKKKILINNAFAAQQTIPKRICSQYYLT